MKVLILVMLTIITVGCNPKKETTVPNVKIVGAMKNVMRKGQLYATIDLDTLKNKKHLYGFGPLEYLRGELLIVDGKAFKSKVVSDTTMKVEETFKAKAPFFGYANIEAWKEQTFPDSIQNLSQFEKYIDSLTKSSKRPFFFKLEGIVESGAIHIVNLPEGSKVSSPEEAHKGQTNYPVKNQEATIIGFFSTEHKTIFTHHDTFLHMHLITADQKKMGHLEEFKMKKGTAKLYLPFYN